MQDDERKKEEIVFDDSDFDDIELPDKEVEVQQEWEANQTSAVNTATDLYEVGASGYTPSNKKVQDVPLEELRIRYGLPIVPKRNYGGSSTASNDSVSGYGGTVSNYGGTVNYGASVSSTDKSRGASTIKNVILLLSVLLSSVVMALFFVTEAMYLDGQWVYGDTFNIFRFIIDENHGLIAALRGIVDLLDNATSTDTLMLGIMSVIIPFALSGLATVQFVCAVIYSIKAIIATVGKNHDELAQVAAKSIIRKIDIYLVMVIVATWNGYGEKEYYLGYIAAKPLTVTLCVCFVAIVVAAIINYTRNRQGGDDLDSKGMFIKAMVRVGLGFVAVICLSQLRLNAVLNVVFDSMQNVKAYVDGSEALIEALIYIVIHLALFCLSMFAYNSVWTTTEFAFKYALLYGVNTSVHFKARKVKNYAIEGKATVQQLVYSLLIFACLAVVNALEFSHITFTPPQFFVPAIIMAVVSIASIVVGKVIKNK